MNDPRFKGLAQAAPWITVALIALMFEFLYNSLAPAPAVSFELPDSGIADSAEPGLVALLIPAEAAGGDAEGALVFFDDARYVLADSAGAEEFALRLGERSADRKSSVLTLLADRRVSAGEVMKTMAIARAAGISRVQLAEKRDQ